MEDGNARTPRRRLQSPDIGDDALEPRDQIALVPAMLLLQVDEERRGLAGRYGELRFIQVPSSSSS